MSDFVAKHRIWISRLLGTGLFAVLLLNQSANAGTLLEPLLFALGLVLVGAGVGGRLWCALYISGNKNRSLVTTGPYSMTRNPLYFFSFLGFVGIGFTTKTFTIPALAAAMFALIYPGVIANEEKVLTKSFGAVFTDYCAKVPRFFPRLALFQEPTTYSVDPRRFREAIIDVLWFIWFVGLVVFLEALRTQGYVKPLLHLH